MGRLSEGIASRKAGLAGVGVLIVVLATGLLIGGGNPAAPRGTPGLGGSITPSTVVTPSATDGIWGPLALPEIPRVADLVALATDAAGILPDSSFGLASLAGEQPAALAARLRVAPAISFAVARTNDAQAELRPTAALTPGAVYRFSLRGTDGVLQGSWSFRVRGPLRVLSTIPATHATEVPVTRAIEFTFDQDGAADITSYLSITPKVAGHVERHGRMQVFVPDRLVPATLYTATLRAGLPRTGTDLALEKDVVVAFETAGGTGPDTRIIPGVDTFEASPETPPNLVVVAVQLPESTSASVGVVVRRFADEASAGRALTSFLAAGRWATYSRPAIATAGLTEVARFTAPLEIMPIGEERLLRFPSVLPAGWYSVELDTKPTSFAFLQVTRVAAWVAELTDRTVVWANDVVTSAPIEGASVGVLGSAPSGTTDARGVAVVRTPSAVVSERPPLMVVRSPTGASVLVSSTPPVGPTAYPARLSDPSATTGPVPWSLLQTDRGLYRQTDTIAAWGYFRERGAAKAGVVELGIVPQDASPSSGPALASVTVTPSPSGAYVGSVPVAALPYGYYNLVAKVAGREISRAWFEVAAIRKPAYGLAVSVDHSAIVSGDSVTVTATASFFDGTPVPSMAIRVTTRDGVLPVGTTGPDGRVTTSVVPVVSDPWTDDTGGSSWNVSVEPAEPEAGIASAEATVLVFPSTRHVRGTATLSGTTLQVSGSVHDIDVARVDRERAAGTWGGNGDAGAVSGAPVTVAVTRVHTTSTQTGTYYDVVEKVVHPIFAYGTTRQDLPSQTVTTGTDGTFSGSLTVPDPDDVYEVTLSSKDPAGRVGSGHARGGREPRYDTGLTETLFMTTDGKATWDARYAIGDTISWRVTAQGAGAVAGPDQRFLYLIARAGLVEVSTSSSADLVRTFGASDVPGVVIVAARFSGGLYAPDTVGEAVFDASSRRLKVTVAPDRTTYRPGEEMTLTVRTRDAAGAPHAADVVVYGVDEKLYAMGAAATPDVVPTLFRSVGSGIVRIVATHQARSFVGGGWGDTMGGGARTEFRDTLFSRLVTTGPDGVATFRVRLSDDITAWHLVAAAFTSTPEAGVGETIVQVGLPLFADVTLADEYLVADRPSVRLRAFGSALAAGDPVVFTVAAPALGISATEIGGTAFSDAMFPLPALTLGVHDLDVSVRSPTRKGSDGRPLTDRVIPKVHVVSSRVTAMTTWYGSLGDTLPPVDSRDLTTYVLSDAGPGRYLPMLLEGVDGTSARLDRLLARDLAGRLLVERFGMDAAEGDDADFSAYPITAFDGETGTSPGIALVPGGGADPWLAARVAALATGPLSTSALRAALRSILDDPGTHRDLAIACLAGLAALGDAVGEDLRASVTATDLTAMERLTLALGFLRLGDETSARTIERELLRQYGEAQGVWARIRVGDGELTRQATALVAVVAAGIGDPLAPALVDYARGHRPTTTAIDLELVAAAGLALERTPVSATKVAYTVEGARTEVSIASGDSLRLTLTPAQRTALGLEQVSGTVGVAVSWRHPLDLASVQPDPTLALTRTLPVKPVAPASIVMVDLSARIPTDSLADGCYEVVEQVPSGLVPFAYWSRGPDIQWPSTIAGQGVTFSCVTSGAHLRYAARVVNAGTFVWEPATMQSLALTTAITASDRGSVTILAR